MHIGISDIFLRINRQQKTYGVDDTLATDTGFGFHVTCEIVSCWCFLLGDELLILGWVGHCV